MNPPIISQEFQRTKDGEHLNLLSIFHFVIAGLALFGIGFLFFHYTIMHTVFENPDFWKSQKNQPPFSPTEFWHIFVWFYLFAGVLLVIASILNLLSGFFLRQRRHRTFSLVVAGLDCLQVPFGTALGVFTFIVLLRDSVRESYRSPGL